MESTFKRKILEIVILLMAIGIILYFNFSSAKGIRYKLLECDAITQCQSIGEFYEESVCEDLRSELNSKKLMFEYACQREVQK